MRLKDLRAASGKTQAQIAKLLDTTQQTYARWESGKAEPPLAALRELALIFSTTVDHILGRTASRPQTTRYHLFADDADGFWGHLGLKLPSVGHTKWYPITVGEADRMRRILTGGFDTAEWAVIQTLNNRMLAFRPKQMQRIWLLDDDCDQPEGDWEWRTIWDDYNGLPIELYRAMDDWAADQFAGMRDFEKNNSPAVRKQALALIEEGKLLDDPDKLDAILHHTVIDCIDGSQSAYHVDPLDLANTVFSLDVGADEDIVALSAYGGDFESYFPAAMLRLIDMPLIDVEEGQRTLDKDLEGAGAEDSTDGAATVAGRKG